MAEALLVGGEAQHALEREARTSVVALGRHEQEVAAGLEHARHLAEEGFVVPDVLEEVDRGHDVEGPAPERQLALADLEHAVAHELRAERTWSRSKSQLTQVRRARAGNGR